MAPERCCVLPTAVAAMTEPLTRLHQWALPVQARRGHNKAAIAVANKLGRDRLGRLASGTCPFAAAPAA